MIILDTDFIVNSIKNKVDFVKDLKENYPKSTIAIIDKTLDELKKINNINSKTAIKLIKVKNIKVIKTDKKDIVDNLILKKSKKTDIVATQDRELKRKLKEKQIKTITIRQKSYVEF